VAVVVVGSVAVQVAVQVVLSINQVILFPLEHI
jgi:hypothetical protein